MPQTKSNGRPTIGLLYPGEMGSALGRLLIEAGCRVVTTLGGRSRRTRELCDSAGLDEMPSLSGVVRSADIVLSVVPPAAALDVAAEFREAAAKLARPSIYVDVNAISPQSVRNIEELLSGVEVSFVDAAIHGLSSHLRSDAVLYLSGAEAGRVADLFRESMNVECLGGTCGEASMSKLLLSGLNKGLIALFLEVGLTAREAGLLEPFLGRCRDYYPGIIEVIERMLPTYPRHAARRGTEMNELSAAIQTYGLQPDIIDATAGLLTRIGRSGLQEKYELIHPRQRASVAELVDLIGKTNPLEVGDTTSMTVPSPTSTAT